MLLRVFEQGGETVDGGEVGRDGVAIACQHTAGDFLSHPCFAHHEEVVAQHVCPELPLLFGGGLRLPVGLLLAPAPEGVCQPQWVDTTLGVDLQHFSVGRAKDIVRHTLVRHEARRGEFTAVGFVVEVVAPDGVGKVHVDHTPRCEDSLLVGEAEDSEFASHFGSTLFDGEFIDLARLLNQFLGGSNQHIQAQEVLYLLERLFREATRHELVPRLLVDKLVGSEVVETEFLGIVHRTEEQQRKAHHDEFEHCHGVLYLIFILLFRFLARLATVATIALPRLQRWGIFASKVVVRNVYRAVSCNRSAIPDDIANLIEQVMVILGEAQKILEEFTAFETLTDNVVGIRTIDILNKLFGIVRTLFATIDSDNG